MPLSSLDIALEGTSPTAHESDAAITRRLDFWNSQLLDLSKRNRLLYFNPAVGPQTRSPHGVKCIEPDCDTIWNRLARLNKIQHFPDLSSEIEQALEIESDEESDEVEDREEGIERLRPLKTDELRTEPGGERLGRVLTNLRGRARVSLEEAGIVTLFLTFGFLRWSEDGESEAYAPLLLVPVELTRASPRDPYRLRRQDEEVLLNPALRYKLENDFKIVLPEAPSLDDKSISSYWQEVQSALSKAPIAAKNNWSVLDWVYVGVFSFHKMAMFRDLRDNRALLTRHPLVRALGGDQHSTVNPDIAVPTGSELDQLPFHEVELVIDADSSQHEAIIAAQRGLSFVLQGPPGTGKSQTITNIIAECLENDKKVLFVSEKMAALDVVHRRLKAAGLGDFCLEAHSHKANKRAVVAELDRTLRLSRLTPPALGVEDEELEQLRQSLNAYVTELHSPHETANLSPYTAISHLAQLSHAPALEFDFSNPTALSPIKREALTQWLQELDRLDGVWRSQATHPWHGARLSDTGLQARERLRSHLEQAAQILGEFALEWKKLCHAWGMLRSPSLHSLKRLLDLATLITEGEKFPHETVAQWIEAGPLEPLHHLAREYSQRWCIFRERRSSFDAHWKETLFAVDATRIRHQIENANEWLERVGGADTAQEKRLELETHFAAATGLSNISQQGAALASTLRLEVPTTLAALVNLHQVAQLVQKQTRPLPAWFAPGALNELETHLEAARSNLVQRRELETQLAGRWQLDALLALPCTEISERFQTRYTSFFARWSGAFKADRKALQGALRNGVKFDIQSATADLKAANNLKAHRQTAETENANHTRRFGPHWRGDQTDWEALQNALRAARDLSGHYNEHVPENLVAVVCGPNDHLELAKEQGQALQTTLTSLQTDTKSLFALFTTRQLPFTDLPFTYSPLSELSDWLAAGRTQLTAYFAALDEIDACATGNFAPTLAQRLSALEDAAFIRQETAAFTEAGQQLHASFGSLFEGATTHWDTVFSALEWGHRVRAWFGAEVSHEFLAVLGNTGRRTTAFEASRAWQTRMEALEPLLDGIKSQFETLSIDDITLEHATFEAIAQNFKQKIARFRELDDWLAYQNLQARAHELGLSLTPPARGFWEELHTHNERGAAPTRDLIAPTFWKRFWLLWIDEVAATLPLLRQFTGDTHEIAIARFARLDSQSQGRARDRLRATLSGKKPVVNLQSPRTGQLGILQREAVKKTRHLALRTLFEQTAEVVQALKPCMLMSPLSVAQFLPPNKVNFDLVVFDEASQITPEDAIGAIVRGTQIIVVGDNQQMPPSNFFGKSESDEDEEASDETARVESILDECLGAGLPQKKLLWHYRSRFEELIAFSNLHYYGNELLTFPGPIVPSEAAHNSVRALSWEHVEGFYTPSGAGSKNDAQTNRIEAKRVAELAVEHARQTPQQSLGIITFNEAQRRAVEEEIYRLTANERQLDDFFWTAREDGFFIKALENVQGDERDAIFFSTGFGPRLTQDGTIQPMQLNFGPLFHKGGERRLNVAVTRARTKVHIVSSFPPEALDLNRAKSEGARLLRAYLIWARDNARVTSASAIQDSALTDGVVNALSRALQNAGWKTHQRIGLGEYRVDIGIEHPDEPGKMLLGVLCDGANYRHSATARDRERLRPQMLERLGWQLHRVWSPDWAKNPDREIQSVLDVLQDAQHKTPASRATGTIVSEFGVPQPVEATGSGVIISESVDFTLPQEQTPNTEDVFTEDSETSILETVLHNEGALFEPVTLKWRGDTPSFYWCAQENPEPILEALLEVVNGEGPVNAIVATRRVAAAWDMTRAGSKLQEIIAQVATQGANIGLMQVRFEPQTGLSWYWPANMVRPEPRSPGPLGERRADEIALEEIAEAAYRIVADGYGFEQDDLVRLTARFFGWKQNGTRVQSRIEAALELLHYDARLSVQNSSYVVRS